MQRIVKAADAMRNLRSRVRDVVMSESRTPTYVTVVLSIEDEGRSKKRKISGESGPEAVLRTGDVIRTREMQEPVDYTEHLFGIPTGPGG